MTTKYPILLVHGIALKDFLGFRAFGNIEKILRREGAVVFTSRIDGFGTIENNAKQLKAEILDILKRTGAEKINLIAHSKGGLDSKYMIARLHMEDRVASLTTLCTPHMGSPVATTVLRFPDPLLHMTNAVINFWYRLFGDEHPDALSVCRELALSAKWEQRALSVSDKVYCQSFSTTLERPRDDFLMGIPLIFSHRYENKKSDGMVSVESAMFKNYRGTCVDGSVSHSEIVDLFAGKENREKIYLFYKALCRELYEMGF